MAKVYLVILLGVSIFFALGWQQQETSLNFYKDALQDANISEKVVIRDTHYQVIRGEVISTSGHLSKSDTYRALRLAYAKATVRRSPIFPLPEVNLEDFRLAVNDLAETTHILAEKQRTPQERQIVISSLYPTEFLVRLADTEQMRRDFLEEGNVKGLLRYQRALTDTITSYRLHLSRFQRAFNHVIPKDFNRGYVMADVILDRSGILETFSVFREALLDLSWLNTSRLRCTRGVWTACNPTDLEIPGAPSHTRSSSDTPEVSLVRIQDIVDVYTRSGLAITGPYIVLLESACVSDRIPPVFALHRGPSGAVVPISVGDIRLTKTSQHSDPFSSFFATYGIVFLRSNELAHYQCVQSGSDSSRVLGVLAIATFAHENVISKSLESFKDKSEAQDLEAALDLSNRGVLTEKDAHLYVELVRRLLEQDALPQHLDNEAVSLLLSIRHYTHGFVESIKKVAFIEATNLRRETRYDIPLDFDAARLFLTESAFFSLLRVESLVSAGIQGLPLNKNTLDSSQQPFLFYSSFVETPGQRDKLIKDLRLYSKIHAGVESFQ